MNFGITKELRCETSSRVHLMHLKWVVIWVSVHWRKETCVFLGEVLSVGCWIKDSVRSFWELNPIWHCTGYPNRIKFALTPSLVNGFPGNVTIEWRVETHSSQSTLSSHCTQSSGTSHYPINRKCQGPAWVTTLRAEPNKHSIPNFSYSRGGRETENLKFIIFN